MADGIAKSRPPPTSDFEAQIHNLEFRNLQKHAGDAGGDEIRQRPGGNGAETKEPQIMLAIGLGGGIPNCYI